MSLQLTGSVVGRVALTETNIRAPLEVNADNFTDAITENSIPLVPTKKSKKKKANNSVSSLPSRPLCITKNPPDQDALLA